MLANNNSPPLLGQLDTLCGALGPKLGAYLVNANCLLLLANERALADVNFRGWNKIDSQSVSRFNERAMNLGLRLTCSTVDLNEGGRNNKDVDAWFESLAGYEAVSHRTRIPGISKFKASDGWCALDQWKRQTIGELDRCAAEGLFPTSFTQRMDRIEQWCGSNSSTTAILNGVMLGYPDTAVMPKATGTWVRTDIAYADLHLGNEPNYSYLRETADLKAVNEHTKRWGMILGDSYHSPQYRQLMRRKRFRAARDLADKFGRPQVVS